VNVVAVREDRAAFTADEKEKVEENACSWLQTSRILRIKKVAEATREGAAILARKAYTHRARSAALQDT
jgi:hypothetical protein